METMELLSSTGDVSSALAPASMGDPSADASNAGVIAHDTYDSVDWTYRNGFGDVLDRVSARAWRNPNEQGWELIKANALREVWRAPLEGRTFYVKYYRTNGFGSIARGVLRGPACRAEWNSGIYALNAGIAAVEPAGCAAAILRDGQKQSLIVTEAVESAQPLNRYWLAICADDDAARRREDAQQLIDLLAEMIARAHQAGFEHMDMHAANILVQPISRRRYRTMFVDLHSARMDVPLGARAVVRNLAQLNQWFRRHASAAQRLRFLRSYLRWRNEYEQSFEHARPLPLSFDRLVRALMREADSHAERLWAQRDRRVRRNGRYFSRIKLPGGWRGSVFTRCKQPLAESRASRMTLDRAWWTRQLANPLRWFDREKTDLCKNSHSATVARAVLEHESGNLPLIVKRPLSRNWRRAIAQRLTQSRSMRGWKTGHAMIHRDIAAARPLAVLERRIGPLVLDNILITEAVPGAVDLETDLRREHAERSPREWSRYKREMCELLVRHVRRLQERGFVHRDCKAANILVVKHPALKLLWIDFDGVRRSGGTPSLPNVLRALMRLHVSLLDSPGLTRTDRLRFLKSFVACFGSDPNAWRSAWRKIDRLAELKIAKRAARRQWKLARYGRE